MAQVSGKAFITLGGDRVRSKEGAKLMTGGVARDPAISDAGVDGFTEKEEVPQVEFTINHTRDVSLAYLQSLKNITLTFETDIGAIWTLKDAWCAKPPELTKGEVTLVFNAVECIEG